MRERASVIKNSEAVTSVFGYWPSFHDAEVIELTMRRRHNSDHGPCIEVMVHVFEMTNKVSSTGHFICEKHSMVLFLFRNVENLDLKDLNHQNALNSLSIKAVNEPQGDRALVKVILDSAYGLDCEFECEFVEVTSVLPGIPDGSIYAGKLRFN